MNTDRNKLVDTSEFWKQRIDDSKITGDIRHSVFRAPEQEWQKVCKDHKDIIKKTLKKKFLKGRVYDILDAGCAYGRGIDLLPKDWSGRYVGIDQSQDFINLAESKYPDYEFYCENLKHLPFEDNEFDVAICTSVMIMVVQNLGWFEWEKIQNELLRVSKCILCLEYGTTDTATASSTFYTIGDLS